jgi:hypothetical protein
MLRAIGNIFILLVLDIAIATAQPLSSHQSIYIPAAANSYSFANYDFAYYNSNGNTFAGIIITSLPSIGTLNYNNTPVYQTDVTLGTVFADRTKFVFVPDVNRTTTFFTFKVKDSRNVVSSQSYTINIKYNTPVSRIVRTDNSKYLEYKGLPYLLYGIQLRIDDYISSPSDPNYVNIYQYFQKTQQAGFKEALVPIRWDWFETADNSFNYKFIDDYIAYAKTYNLRLQFLWMGSNVCAYMYAPTYISYNQTTYPRSTASVDILNYSNVNLIAKEVRAVKNLMAHLATYDTEKRVVLVQVENEPDHMGPSTVLWAGGQKDAVIHMIDTLGQVIHASAADMITRVNLTGYTTTANDFANVKGINIVGRDIYAAKYNPDFLNNSSLFENFWNYNYTPENGAQYRNGVNLALSAFERANGYLMYELRTSGWRATTSSENGLYRKTTANDWIERDGTQTCTYWASNYQQEVNMDEIKSFNEMIYKADKRIASCPASKITAFNLDDLQGAVNENKSFSTYTVTYSSSIGGEAQALEDMDGGIILLSLKDNSSFTFQSLPTNFRISIGYFDDLNLWHQTSSRNIVGNNVMLNAKEVALLTSTVYSNDSTVVPTVKKSSSVNIYPNPNHGQFNMNLTSFDFTPKLLEVYNLNSQLVYSQFLTGEESSFNIQGVKKGMYLLNLSGINTDKTFVNKLIIN